VLAAVQWKGGSGQPGGIFLSLDAGQNWFQADYEVEGNLAAVAVSGDASALTILQSAGSSGSGAIYTFSVRGGDNSFAFASTPIPGKWRGAGAALRLDYVAVVQYQDGTGEPGFVYSSSNGGGVYYRRNSAGSAYWAAVTSSSDGSRFAAVQDMTAASLPGIIVGSNDYGESWSPLGGVRGYWSGISSSSNGSLLVAVQRRDDQGNPGWIYLSSSSGNDWYKSSAPQAHWSSVASSGERADDSPFSSFLHPTSDT